MWQLHIVPENNNEAIEMIKLSLSVVRVAAFCVPLVLVASCGSGAQAVQGSKITINPAATAQTVPAGYSGAISNKEYTIFVASPTGYAEVGVSLIIDSPGTLSAVSTSTPHTYTPLGAAGAAHVVTTDGNGTYTVAISYTSGTTPTGDVTILNARSGTGYNRVNITYTCVDAIAPLTPATCP